MAAVGTQAVAVVGVPDRRGVVLGAGEEEVAVAVVAQERERALVPLHQDRPHGGWAVLVVVVVVVLAGGGEWGRRVVDGGLGKGLIRMRRRRRRRENPRTSRGLRRAFVIGRDMRPDRILSPLVRISYPAQYWPAILAQF